MDEHLGDAGGLAGEGEHLYLLLEKVGDNTDYVARTLAGLVGCRAFDVGYCGLKDRHAVTTQWFSLYRPGMEQDDAALIERIGEHWRVLSETRAPKKLRRGDHAGNRFTIVLRAVSGDRRSLDEALCRLRDRGAPNYFGPQRFGRGGGNLDKALQIDPARLNRRSKRGAKGGSQRTKNVLYFSAARSWLFNEVLAARVSDGSWRDPLPGESAAPVDAPTGPMWGDGGTDATGDQERLERDVVAQHPDIAALFSATRMKPERRPLVARPDNLTWCWLADDVLEVQFQLAPGQFATTVLGDVLELEDRSLGPDNQ
ncbi:pseudouridylate synthase [Marinobacter santoriniensis NKSG1]|uniref:Pseudouridylate synthase n=1 Tax=Marinobacter santoriniensis NKSG1 TaxID=1288826 RepID=M7DFN6_9GAMM|nr:pseudouridylate synthase [Marinobacter santoriniensis NKSG1]